MSATLLILGATGDLAHRYLGPALCELAAAGLLPPGLRIVGAAIDEHGGPAFIASWRAEIEAARGNDPRHVDVSFETVDASDSDDVARLVADLPRQLIAYLALPPALFEPSLRGLAAAAPGTQVAIEKPFGTDGESARTLNALAAAIGDETAVHRVDHFLGHATVQNILGLRFANAVFEPLWDRRTIRRVDIVWDETITVEGRAAYYDHTGALRDMIQNHLLQLVALIAMEPPVTVGERDLRDRKVELLRAVRVPDPSAARRARYGSGDVNGRAVPRYVDEPDVEEQRNTETFAEVCLAIDNWRWADVPFTLRTGKALGAPCREIRVTFRDVPHQTFGHATKRNQLRLRLDPDTVALAINVNASDERFAIGSAEMQLALAPTELSAYARVLRDLLQGDPALSIRGDEAEESWRIVEPTIDAWRDDTSPIAEYAAGMLGPDVAARIDNFEPRAPAAWRAERC